MKAHTLEIKKNKYEYVNVKWELTSRELYDELEQRLSEWIEGDDLQEKLKKDECLGRSYDWIDFDELVSIAINHYQPQELMEWVLKETWNEYGEVKYEWLNEKHIFTFTRRNWVGYENGK